MPAAAPFTTAGRRHLGHLELPVTNPDPVVPHSGTPGLPRHRTLSPTPWLASSVRLAGSRKRFRARRGGAPGGTFQEGLPSESPRAGRGQKGHSGHHAEYRMRPRSSACFCPLPSSALTHRSRAGTIQGPHPASPVRRAGDLVYGMRSLTHCTQLLGVHRRRVVLSHG